MIPSSASAPPSPTEIGPFRILEPPLGQGGMGVVYRAEHRETKERVALKTVRVLFPSELASIRAEIHALTRLRHPGVVRIIGGGVTEGKPWYTMELLEGRTMADYLRELWRPFRDAVTARIVMGPTRISGDRLDSTASTVHHDEILAQTIESFPDEPSLRSDASRAPDRSDRYGDRPSGERWPVAGGHLEEALTLVRRLCDPLAFIHSHGMVHRDLKPGNVFIRPDDSPVLMDFGLVSRFRSGLNRERLEVAGQVMGTAAYIAPEQVRGLFVDARADLYALGCMLYELLTGRVPFTAPTTVEVLYQHLDTPPERVSAFVDGVPPELDDLVARLLAKRGGDRIGYAEDVAAALERLGARPPVGPQPPRPRAYLYRPDMQGRSEVIADLANRFDGVREGRGGMTLIGGESGVGKTFLASEAARQAGGRKLRVVVGECLPVAVSGASMVSIKEAPLHPLRNLLLTIADVCREKGRAHTERVLGRRGRVLAMYEPSLAGLPGLEAQPEPPELPAQEARQRLFDDLKTTLAEFSRDQPLLILLDDIQWADELTLGLLRDFGAEFFDRKPIYLIATYRSEEVGSDIEALRALPHVHRIDLGRLDEKTVGAIAGGMLAMSRPPEAFVNALARLTEGNPFFLAEYLRAAVDEGLLVRETGSWRLRDASEARSLSGDSVWDALELPRSLRALVARRLAGLSQTAMRLAEAGAVLGRESDLALLLAVSGIEENEALEGLGELRLRQVLIPIDSGEFRFVHDKLREIAHAGIPEERRREMHSTAAAAIEARLARGDGPPVPPSILAHHFRAAEKWAKAIDYHEKAATEALAAFSNGEAQRYVLDAQALSARLPAPGLGPLRLGRFEGMLVETHWRVGEHGLGRVHAERALAHFQEPMPRTPAGFKLGLLGQVLLRMLPAALSSLLRPRDRMRHQLTVEAANVFNRMFDALLWNNEALPAVYCGLRGVTLSERVEPGKALARGLALLSVIVASTPLRATALRWAKRSIDLAERLGDPSTLSYCLGRISGIALSRGDFAEAMGQLGRAHDVARETRNHRAIEECHVIGASYRFIEGDFSGSQQDCGESMASAGKRGDGQTRSWGRSGMAHAMVRLGQEEAALKLLDEDEEWRNASGQRLEVSWALAVRALARLQLGDLERAAESADTAFEWMQRERVVGYMWHPIVVAVAEVYLALWQARADADRAVAGRLAKLAEKAIAVLAGFTTMYPFAAPSLAVARARRAEILGRDAEVRRSASQALAAAVRMKLRFEEAQAHLLLATLGSPGDAERARHLAAAEEIFTALRCNRELLRLRQERERIAA